MTYFIKQHGCRLPYWYGRVQPRPLPPLYDIQYGRLPGSSSLPPLYWHSIWPPTRVQLPSPTLLTFNMAAYQGPALFPHSIYINMAAYQGPATFPHSIDIQYGRLPGSSPLPPLSSSCQSIKSPSPTLLTLKGPAPLPQLKSSCWQSIPN